MNKLRYFIALIFLFSGCAYAQDYHDYKVCVNEFYRLLYSSNNVSINDFSRIYSNASPSYEVGLLVKIGKLKESDYFKHKNVIAAHADAIDSQILLRMRAYKNHLTRGLSYESICQQIEESSVFDEGTEFTMLLELNLSNGLIIFFEINKDTPKQIQYIWLSTGESLSDLVLASKELEMLKRPGIITDPDGFTNIRLQSNNSAQIVGRFLNDDIFFYTPSSESDWWAVYKQEGGPQVGYVHKNRILKYSDFPPKLKEQVKKKRRGC